MEHSFKRLTKAFLKSRMKTKFASCRWIIFPLVLVVLGASLISISLFIFQHASCAMQDAFDDTHRVLLAHIQDQDRLFIQANSSVFNIARILGSSPDKNLSSFFAIENEVAPKLFMAFGTISWVSQISYIGLNGLIFAYYYEGNQARAMFTNTSCYLNDCTTYHLYSQPVDLDRGQRYSDATAYDPLQSYNSKWISEALRANSEYATWGWSKDKNMMFFFTALVDKLGVISLGTTVKGFVEYISSIDLHGGHLYLVTKNGHFLAQIGPTRASYVLNNDTTIMHMIYQNDVVSMKELINISCHNVDSNGKTTWLLNTLGKRYEFGCAPLDVTGIQLVCILAFPYEGSMDLFPKMEIIGVLLLSFLILILVIGSCIVVYLFREWQVQETFLRASLIKQKEAIQQAERKSMNTSSAFASASHDVRASLAGITGLIEICRAEIPLDSGLDKKLVQMNVCASKLLGILNSVLDISKVEAGKMQLEEVEFNMAQVLEESIDIFHVVALKKGLEVIWDPCDCSVLKCSNVKGDCRRLKQIIDNLLSNAVKFTSEGHVEVRVWSKNPDIKTLEHSPKHRYRFFDLLDKGLQLLSKDKNSYMDLDSLKPLQLEPNSIEFVFEIDDTGIGIQKEKRSSVFENYIQVKESILEGHEGTGLGLGIVRSYVRLMGGEINIQDKEPGERGTCFRFNIFMKSSETSFGASNGDGRDFHNIQVSRLLQLQNPSTSNVQQLEEHVMIQSNIQSMAFRKGLKMEGIHSLLLVQGVETSKILQRWMVSLSIEVWPINRPELLCPTLQNIKHILTGSEKIYMTPSNISFNNTSPPNSILESREFTCSNDVMDLPLTVKDISRKTSFGGFFTCIIVIIDLSFGDISEICLALKIFAKSIQNIRYKIVWLVNPNTSSTDLERFKHISCDLLLQKPIHGSRLYALLKLLQEIEEGCPSENAITNTSQDAQKMFELSSSESINHIFSTSLSRQSKGLPQQGSTLNYNKNDDKPLNGMKILLVEDTSILRHLAYTMLSRLGATIESSENGLEALNLIKKALQEARVVQQRFPYDLVLMDCEMPIMNGYEATRHIRAEEKQYNHRIPIIALTAHATFEEEKKTVLSGMDFHLTKPLQTNKLVEAIRSVCHN